MTEIEIPDEEGEPADEREPPRGAYRNLFVPLVVVPALIVMVLVLVFALFGALAGREDSPRQNLQDLLQGGFNERQQAAFSLVRQILDHLHALAEEREPEWEIDESFLPEVRSAREQLGEIDAPGDVPRAFVLSSLMALLGDPAGVRQLVELTRLSEELDPGGDFRVNAAFILGAVGPELAESERRAAAEALIQLLESPDDGLVLAAAAGLQNLPAPETVPALRGLLDEERADLRLTAALALVALGDDEGAGVLREMIEREPYLAERARAPERWAPQRVSESRLKALAGLLELGLAPEREQLERWAERDEDPAMRQAARELLEGS